MLEEKNMSVRFECPQCRKYGVLVTTRGLAKNFNCPYCKKPLKEDKGNAKDKRNNNPPQSDTKTK